MPDPISGQNQSVYQPDAPDASGCDPSVASCAAPGAPEPPHTVMLGPVYITGNLDSGAQELVRRHDDGGRCFAEKLNAALTCGLAALSGISTAASSPTGVGLLVGSTITAGLSAQCARDVVQVGNCEERLERLAELEASCASRAGVLLQGAEGPPVCLVVR